MNRIFTNLLVTFLLFFLAGFEFSQGQATFNKKFGGSNADEAYSSISDSLGNTFVTGVMRGTASIGGINLTSSGATDIFVSKIDVNGSTVASIKLGGAGGEFVNDITLDDSGNVYLAGFFAGTANIGTYSFNSTNGTGIVVKLNSNLSLVWARQYGNNNTSIEQIAVDRLRNIYFAARHEGNGTVSFGSVNINGQCLALVRISPLAQIAWVRSLTNTSSFSSPGPPTIVGLETDNNNSIYLTGSYSGTLNLSNGGGSLSGFGFAPETYVIRYNQGGLVVYSLKAGGNFADTVKGLAVDGSGNAVITGTFLFNFTIGSLSASPNLNSGHLYIAMINASGTPQWLRSTTQTGFTTRVGASSISRRFGDMYYVSGSFTNPGTASLPGGFSFPARNSSEIFLLAIDNSGDIRWLQVGNSNGNRNEIVSVSADIYGNVYATGTYASNFSFAGNNLNSNGSTDGYLIKLSDHLINTSVVLPKIRCAGDTIPVLGWIRSNNFWANAEITVELSGPDGSFRQAKELTKFTPSTLNGAVRAPIPQFGMESSNNYRIRLKSTRPLTYSLPFDTAITIYSRDTANAGVDRTLCAGLSTQVSTTGGTNWRWSPGIFANDSTIRNPILTPPKTTTFTVYVTDLYGCAPPDTDQIVITVFDTLRLNPINDTIVCDQTPLTFIASSIGGVPGTINYVWNPISLENDTLLFNADSAADLRVLANDLCGFKDSIDLKVKLKPKVSLLNPRDTTICYGNSISLNPQIIGGDSNFFSYRWTLMPDTILNISLAKNIIVSPLVSSVYRFIVSDPCTKSADTIFYNINVRAPLVLRTSNDTTICMGNSAGLRAFAFGGLASNYKYTWTRLSDGLNLGNSSSITVKPSLNESYKIKLEDACSNPFDSSIIRVNVRDSIKIEPIADTLICLGQEVKINAYGFGGIPSDYSFIWRKLSNNQFLSNTPELNITGVQEELVQVVLSDGCSQPNDTFVFRISIRDPLELFSTRDTLICYGSKIYLKARLFGGNASSYEYEWRSLPGDIPQGYGDSILINPTITTVYKVIGRDFCTKPSDSTTLEVRVLPPINSSLDGDTLICYGETANLTGSVSGGLGSSYVYKWYEEGNPVVIGNNPSISVNPLVSTNYWRVSGDNCSDPSDSQKIHVRVRDPLTIDLGNDTTICKGNLYTVEANAGGGRGTYFYIWNPAAGNVSKQSFKVDSSVWVKVQLNDGCSNPIEDSVYIISEESPEPNISVVLRKGCVPFDVEFQDISTIYSPSETYWDFGDGIKDTVSTGSTIIHTYTNSGLYSPTIWVKSENGCLDSVQVKGLVNAEAPPIASFIWQPKTPTSGSNIIFSNKSVDAINYFWEFTNGYGSSNLRDPEFLVTDSNGFNAQLIVESRSGCRDTVSNFINVVPGLEVWIPNAFSPDKNGINDDFKPYGLGFTSYRIQIFTRWGQMVYDSKETGKGWNGTWRNEGEGCLEQLYIYKVTVLNRIGETQTFVGEVLLLKQ